LHFNYFSTSFQNKKLNEAIIIDLTIGNDESKLQIKAGEVPGIITMKGRQSQTESLKIHPGKPTTIFAIMKIQWDTNRYENVQKVRRTLTVRCYLIVKHRRPSLREKHYSKKFP
jgi:hypothetical protein